jgi:hypothetical protein
MDDRRFTEVDLRRMLETASGIDADVIEGRWFVRTRFRRSGWEIIVEPDEELELVVVITAYPVN